MAGEPDERGAQTGAFLAPGQATPRDIVFSRCAGRKVSPSPMTMRVDKFSVVKTNMEAEVLLDVVIRASKERDRSQPKDLPYLSREDRYLDGYALVMERGWCAFHRTYLNASFEVIGIWV